MPRIPGVNHRRAIRALERAGFRVMREGRKHVVMSDGTRFLTIPRNDPLNAYTMGGIVADAGLTVEEFKALL
jgi:predicted RNA binding protein YcfA (HicA-like mRNA interferase family)